MSLSFEESNISFKHKTPACNHVKLNIFFFKFVESFEILIKVKKQISKMDMTQKIEMSKQYMSSLKDSIEHNQEQAYKLLAKNYDEVMVDTGYQVSRLIGEMCVKYILDKSENAQILDIASG